MTREDIIRMAEEAGGFLGELPRGDAWLFLEEEYLERFAVLVAAAEREKINDEAKAHLQELRNNFDVESPELRLHKWTRGQA